MPASSHQPARVRTSFLRFLAPLMLFAGPALAQINVSPGSVNVPPSGATGLQLQVFAASSVTWTASVDQPWVTIVAGSSGQGNGTIVYNVEANPAATSRMATFTITSDLNVVHIPLNELEGILAVSPSSANVPGSGGGGTITVSSNDPALVWTITSNQPWLTFSGPASRVGSGNVEWTVEPNTTTANRSAILTITPANGNPIPFFINQSPGSFPDLTISKTHSGTFTQGGSGTIVISVSNIGSSPTNGLITVSDPMPPGLTATAASGPGWSCTVGPTVTCTRSGALGPGSTHPPITVTVSVAPNAPPSITNTVTVSGGGEVNTSNNSATDTVPITQGTDLSIAKSHPSSFTAGQSGTYSITVSNAAGVAPSTGTVTVTDTIPAGLTVTAASGSGWACTVGPTVTCSRGDSLAPGSQYPPITLTVLVAASLTGTVNNTATVSGGGDVNAANNSATDVTGIIVAPPNLQTTKSHTANFTVGQIGARYTITIANSADAGATTGDVVTVTDTLPTGLTATAATGQGWVCTVASIVTCTRNDVLATGASYPPITLTVNVGPDAFPLTINRAVVTGGGDVTPANNTASDPTTVVAIPDLSITKTHTGDFVIGQTGAYTIVVSNAASAGPTTGAVTVTDTVPTGLTVTAATGSGWTCTVGQTVACTRGDSLPAGASYPPITLTVSVSSGAASTVINGASVSAVGDVNPNNNSATDPTSIVSPPPDLSMQKSHSGGFIPGQTGTWILQVSNSGTGPTSGTVTVTDPQPAGLTAVAATGSGWTCATGATVTCNRSDALPPGASYPPITITVSVAADAPPTATNTATVAGGGDTSPGNNTATDSTSIPASAAPDLSIAKSHNGTLTGGQPAVYTIVVSSAAGGGATTGTVTVTDNIPTGLTAVSAAGTGWSCTVGATVACTRSDVLAAGSSYPPITLSVNVATDAPAVIINTAVVSGGGDNTPANNSTSDPSPITAVPDLTIGKSHSGILVPGQTVTYTIVVSNAATSGPTAGTVTINDTLPFGLTATAATGDGWTCTVSATVSCTRADVLAAGASYPSITLTANIASDAPTVIANTVTVSGGGDVTPGNNTTTDASPVDIDPNLTLAKTHTGAFTAGQTAAFSLVVSNLANTASTTGTVTVTDSLPTGLTAVSASGSGWTCDVTNVPVCTRSDALAPGASYPPITLTVNVAASATASITNTASVSGGGDRTPANNTASDTATIAGAPPSLTIDKSATGSFIPGQPGAYTIVISNIPNSGPTAGTVTVTDNLSAGITVVSASGDGWDCTAGPPVSCSRSDVLPAGANYPPITLVVSVAPDAPASITNSASVSGGGSPPVTSPPDVVPVNPPPDLSVTKMRTTEIVPGQPATYSVVVSNAATAGPTTSATSVVVSDTLPPGLSPSSATGPSWICTLGLTTVCTRNDVLQPGASYPPITLVVSVAPDAQGTIINSASVSGGGDTSGDNNSSPDIQTPIPETCLTIAAAPDPNFGANGTGSFHIIVSNPSAAATSGNIIVTATPPLFTSPVNATGDGWSCTVLAQTATCSRSDSLAAHAQFPPIVLTVRVNAASTGATGVATFYVNSSLCTRPVNVSVPVPDVQGPQGPVINLVTNAASFITPGQSNYGIAPGSLVTIFGSGIGPDTPASMDALPLDPSSFAGVHVQATVGSTSLGVPVFFASAGQLNVLLPSSIPLGDGTFVVTFNGQSTPPFPVRVVKTNVGIFAPNRQGYGPGAALNAFPGGIVETNTVFQPAKPGQIVELWATGLGAVQGDEFSQPLPGSVDVPVEIYVGGTIVPPMYAGRSGCCVGTDQIHFVVPDKVEGCYVPVFVKAGGVVSNTITLAFSADAHCTDAGGLTSSELDNLQNGGVLISGTISLNRSILAPNSANQDYALQTFRSLNQSAILLTEPDFPVPLSGACTVGQSQRDGQGLPAAAPLYTPADTFTVFPFREKPNPYMNAGNPTIMRGSTTQPLAADSFSRYFALVGPPSTLFDPGTVMLSNVPQPVVIPAAPQSGGFSQNGSNLPQTGDVPLIDRSLPLMAKWSGGDSADDLAVIAGFKSITSLSGGRQGITATTWFVCTAPLESGSFTVPAQILQAMPTGLPVTGPNGEQLPWFPGAPLNDPTVQKSSLSIGSIRKPDLSRITAPGVNFDRLFHVLVNKQNVDYR